MTHGPRPRLRATRVLLVLALATTTLLLSAPGASAHNVLISSDPAAGAVLATAPTTVTLVFDQDVQSVYPEMAITIGSDTPVEFTPQVNGRDVTANLRTIALPKTSPSAGLMPWKIGYRIVSADGHPVTGLVQFAIGNAPTHPAAASGISADATSSTGDPAHPPTWIFLVLGIVLVLIATIAALLLLRRFIRRPAPAPSPNNPPNDKVKQ